MPAMQDLERLLIDKKITRRDFIERMAAIGGGRRNPRRPAKRPGGHPQARRALASRRVTG